MTALSADNIDNLGRRIEGRAIALHARGDLTNLGGRIAATDSLSVSAGRDLNVVSTTRDSASAQGRRTSLARVAGLYVTDPGGTLAASAGRDVNLQAAEVVNRGEAGQTLIAAGRDLNLTTVTESSEHSVTWNRDNWRKDSSRSEVGTTIHTAGDTIRLTAGERTRSLEEAHKVRGSNSLFSSETTTTYDAIAETTAQGTTFSGETTVLQAGGDIALEGSHAVSTAGTSLRAGDNIQLKAATHSVTETHDKQVKKSGLFSSGGLSITAGTQRQSVADDATRRSAAASTVGATDGDVTITAGGRYRQVGSDVVAPKGDIAIASSEQAVTDGKNRLSTTTLSDRDLTNRADYDANQISLGVGYGAVGTDQAGDAQSGAEQVPGSELPSENGVSATAPVALYAEDSDRSTTRSGISGGDVTVADDDGHTNLAGLDRTVTSDADTANALNPIFDQAELEAGFEIAGALTRETGTFLANRAREATEAQAALEAERAKPAEQQDPARIAELTATVNANQTWAIGGTGRTVVTALTAAAGGQVTGSGAQFLQAAAVNHLQSLAAREVKEIADSLDSESARAALHGVVGCAGATAQGADCGTGALGAASSVVLNNLIDQVADEDAATLTPAQKEARTNLVATLVGDITETAGGEAAGAATAAARIETENNAAFAVISHPIWSESLSPSSPCQPPTTAP